MKRFSLWLLLVFLILPLYSAAQPNNDLTDIQLGYVRMNHKFYTYKIQADAISSISTNSNNKSIDLMYKGVLYNISTIDFQETYKVQKLSGSQSIYQAFYKITNKHIDSQAIVAYREKLGMNPDLNNVSIIFESHSDTLIDTNIELVFRISNDINKAYFCTDNNCIIISFSGGLHQEIFQNPKYQPKKDAKPYNFTLTVLNNSYKIPHKVTYISLDAGLDRYQIIFDNEHNISFISLDKLFISFYMKQLKTKTLLEAMKMIANTDINNDNLTSIRDDIANKNLLATFNILNETDSSLLFSVNIKNGGEYLQKLYFCETDACYIVSATTKSKTTNFLNDLSK